MLPKVRHLVVNSTDDLADHRNTGENGDIGMPLATTGEPGHHEIKTDNVYFWMVDGTRRVRCAVTLEALKLFDPKLDRRGGGGALVRCFEAHRKPIERAASVKFDNRYAEPDGTVIVKKQDFRLTRRGPVARRGP
jgi:hypothetical protein